jgi:hypothetical protein
MPNKELALSLSQQIRERHEQNIAIDQELRDVLLRKLNSVRELGVLIAEAKETLTRPEFAQATTDIPGEAVRAYMAFARQHREPITEVEAGMKSMRSTYIALQTGGLLPFSDGHGLQTLRQQPSFVPEIIQASAKLAHTLRHHLKSHPLRQWDPQDVEQVLAGLQPVLSVFKQLRLFLDDSRMNLG